MTRLPDCGVRLPKRRAPESGRRESLVVVIYRLEGVPQVVVGDLATQTPTRGEREVVVQPSPSPCVIDLLEQVSCGGEVLQRIQVTGHSRGVETVDVDVNAIFAEESAQYLCHRRRERSVRRWVFWMIGGHDHPEYPSAHASLTSAVAEVLSRFLGKDRIDIDVHGFDPTGVAGNLNALQHFTTARDLLEQVNNARAWGGLHYDFSLAAGRRLGREVADYDLRHAFEPIDDDD